MKPQIDDYLIGAIHTLPVRTFASLGFSTRVALSNDSHLDEKYVTDYVIQARTYDPGGALVQHYENLGVLRPQEKLTIDLNDITGERERDQLVFFSLIPKRVLDASSDKIHCSISFEELRFLVNSQGHHVEYCRPDGYSTGILYAAGAFNYKKFHNDIPTTLLQAPKAFVSRDIDTLVTLINSCPDPGYDQTHKFTYAVTFPDGTPICSSVEELPAFTTKTLSVRAIVNMALPDKRFETDQIEFFCVSGFCTTGLLVPLVFSSNATVNTLAVEHTFGPWIYGTAVTGSKRRAADVKFRESVLFNSSRHG